jgi:hypothetical protein
MKFNIGDKVRFLNETGEGIVTKIINKNSVGVTIEDGFELPFLISELVAIYNETNEKIPFTAPQIVEEIPVVYISNAEKRKETEKGIYLALSPEKLNDIGNTDFNLWLINHTLYDIYYCASIFTGNNYEVFDRGEMAANNSKLIETIDKKKIDGYSTIKLDVLFFSKKPFEHQEPLSEIIKIKPARLFKQNAFLKNDFIPEEALIINVFDFKEDLYFEQPESKSADLSKLLFQKRSSSQSIKTSKPHRINNPEYDTEIDLHIEELIENYGGMSNAEIIQVQLRHFQKALDKAINERYRTLTVIHGVGNGRLKQEVRAILKSMNIRFQDGSYSKYGFGATEVVIS